MSDGSSEVDLKENCYEKWEFQQKGLPFAPASRSASAWVMPKPRPAPETRITLSLRLNSGSIFTFPVAETLRDATGLKKLGNFQPLLVLTRNQCSDEMSKQ